MAINKSSATTDLVIDGIKVPLFQMSPKHFIRQSTCLFGASGSGKSTVLLDIMYQLKDYIPCTFIFSETEEFDPSFEGIVPSAFVYSKVDPEKLKEIYLRQKEVSEKFNTVNKIENLELLFRKIASQNELRKVEEIIKLKSSKINDIMDKYPIYSEQKPKLTMVEKIHNETLGNIYKKCIRDNKARLMAHKLEPTEMDVVKYLDLNPNILIVFDDCAADIKQWGKDPTIRRIFYQGRHLNITSIYTFQDDKDLDSSFKKNAFTSIFTTQQCAVAYFQRASTNFTKQDKQLTEKLIPVILKEGNILDPNWKKFVYMRNAMERFQYTIAEVHKPFRMGCDAIWMFSDRTK